MNKEKTVSGKYLVFRDSERCIGCYACVIACRIKNNLLPDTLDVDENFEGKMEDVNLIRINRILTEEGGKVLLRYVPVSCLHCVSAPCAVACPVSAISKDLQFSCIKVDREKCTGCRVCLEVCPVGAPRFLKGKMIVCDLCIDRLKEEKLPLCVQVCIAKAIHIKI